MGKATRWLKGLLGIKRSDPNTKQNPKSTPTPTPTPSAQTNSKPKPFPNSPKEKRRWSFVKSYREKSSSSSSSFHSRQTADSVLVTPNLQSQSGESPSNYSSVNVGDTTTNKHAIAVAAASAAAAEAAVAAAKAAAAVVRLTNSGRSNVRVESGMREQSWAAVVIQSHFRGYLARRALRALKGLVKLQALVRGHIMRKKAAETMKCMQAMLRAQTRARVGRGVPLPSVSPHSSGKSTTHHGPPTPEKFERAFQPKNASRDQSPLFKRNSSRSSGGSRGGQDQVYCSSSISDLRTDDEPTWDHNRGDKILEIDPGKPTLMTPPKRRKNLFETSSHSGVASDRVSSHLHSCTTSWDSTAHQQTAISPMSCEVVQQLPTSLNPLKFAPFTANNYNNYHNNNEEEGEFCTAENSPQFCTVSSSASSRRGLGAAGVGMSGPFTPTKSDGSFSGLSGYSDCPSYMAYTESSRAKIRSLSAPRQRPNYEQLRTSSSSSTKRWSAHHQGTFGEAGRTSSHIVRGSDHNLGMGAAASSSSALLHSSGFVAVSGGKAYPGSGRLDRLGMPVVKDNTVVYYSGYLN